MPLTDSETTLRHNATTLVAAIRLAGCQATLTDEDAFPVNAMAATAHPATTGVACDAR